MTCPAICYRNIACQRDAGHEGQHEAFRPGVTHRWSDPLCDECRDAGTVERNIDGADVPVACHACALGAQVAKDTAGPWLPADYVARRIAGGDVDNRGGGA